MGFSYRMSNSKELYQSADSKLDDLIVTNVAGSTTFITDDFSDAGHWWLSKGGLGLVQKRGPFKLRHRRHPRSIQSFREGLGAVGSTTAPTRSATS